METPVATLLVPGVKLGRYELIRNLAVGGMAELFLARASGLEGFEKLVVIKRILPQLAAHADFIKMFLDEARIAALLHHPNIAQVYDFGRAGESYFFTMEYVQGKDLRELIRAAKRRGGLPLEHALSIVLGVAAGLHYAHEKAGPDGAPLCIVHRDVSPANVLVTCDGGVKLVDFGVAKARSRQTETRAGTLKGKIAYMSPEQCKGEDVDRRSDVFALGILLYELSTGTRLFKGENEFAILREIATQDVPPPSTRKPGYAPALEAIVLRALQRDPQERYATAEELQLDLESFVTHERLVVSSVGLRRYWHELFPEPEAVPMLPMPRTPSASQSRKPATLVLEADAPNQEEVGWDGVAPAAELPIIRTRHWWAARGKRIAALATGVGVLIPILVSILGSEPRSSQGVDVKIEPIVPAETKPVLPTAVTLAPRVTVEVPPFLAMPRAAETIPLENTTLPKHRRVHTRRPSPGPSSPQNPVWDPDSPFLPMSKEERSGP